MKFAKRRVVLLVICMIAVTWLVWYIKLAGHHLTLQMNQIPPDFWGVTFSKKYAAEIDLNWREVYLALLDELKVKRIRIPIYWDDIEQKRGQYNFTDYDWMLQQGAERGVKFIVNIGRRLPRWPECHQPSWTKGRMAEQEIDASHLAMTKAAVEHFRQFDVLEYWQLENEYFFPWFGECPKANLNLIRDEIAFLKSHDSRPLVLTDSGELNNWWRAAQYSDILGTTMYRVVWNNYIGYFRAPWPASLYRFKAKFAGKAPSEMIIAELQAEPWASGFRNPTTLPQSEWERSFNLQQFETNAELSRRTGFLRAYFWGVEWWYWLLKHGDASMWMYASKLIAQDHEDR